MKNYIGEELKVGDKVVYINRHMTGSSSTNKTLCVGVIKRFTPKTVVIDTGRNTGKDYLDEYKVDPSWIACIVKEEAEKLQMYWPNVVGINRDGKVDKLFTYEPCCSLQEAIKTIEFWEQHNDFTFIHADITDYDGKNIVWFKRY